MKKKYILETYDKIIKEIKNPKLTLQNEYVEFLKTCSNNSFLIYKIDFVKENGEIRYKINKTLHNFHPKSENHKIQDCLPTVEQTKLIPKILSDIKCKSKEVNLRWHSQNGHDILYVMKQSGFSDLSEELIFFLYCFQTLKKENERIKSLNKETIFNFKSKEKVEQYIYKKQYALENLATKLIKEINPSSTLDLYKYSGDYTQKDCLKVTYIYLEKLIRFIEKEYASYLNENIQIPYRTILFKEYEMKPIVDFVKDSLLDLNINKKLLQIIYAPILKLSTINIQAKMSYQEFNYCIEITKELNRIFQNESKKRISKKLSCWLIELNFNGPEFLKYLTDKCVKDLNSLEDYNSKIDYLYKNLKEINQIQIMIHNRWNNNIPEIKEQLVKWLEEEIHYHKKKIKNTTNIHKMEDIPVSSKLHFNLSVAQLAWFINILIKSKIIKTDNQKEVIRFFANNSKTDNQENISSDSLISKYYNVEQSSREVIKTKIIELLNRSK